MKTHFPVTVIELSPEEAIEVYYALRRQLEHTIETHWVNHPDSYERSESMRLHLISQLHRSVGHDDNPLKAMRDHLDTCVKKKNTSAKTS